ncbi:MAG: HAD-IA family hydrolase [Nitrospiraceae bacterium]|nr:HAD-IA family hydrolase [Nitrospiraceae bacterium]
MYSSVPDIKQALEGHDISHVLLDMDGTLLDRYFDDYFWEHLVPEKYADLHNISFGRAKEELLAKYRSQEETLNWTDIEYWSCQLGIDILALKEQIRHLIEVHPHVEAFLKLMRERKKKIYIATNAHDKVLALKMKKTELGRYLTGTITSIEMGYPKEHQEFWRRAEKRLQFRREHTLFVDDTAAVLASARRYGIRYLVFKAKGNSKMPLKKNDDFATIVDFNELI